MRVRQIITTARAPLAVAAVLLAAGAGLPATAAADPPPASGWRDPHDPDRTVVSDPAQYVNPFVGTKPGDTDFGNGGGGGNTFPGATSPLGMVQWSPDTVTYQHGGYYYDDQRIRGFSLTHLSGAGCGDYGNIPFLPFLGDTPVGHEAFSHAHESAEPDAYGVTFDNGLRTELTTTQRSGAARISYPAGQAASLTVDAGRAFNKAGGHVEIGTDTISGYSDGGGFCGSGNRYRVYFTARFDHPFTRSGVVRDGGLDTTRRSATGGSDGIAPQPARTAEAQSRLQHGPARPDRPVHPDAPDEGSGARAMVSFAPGSTVTVRVGLSFTSAAGAAANLDAEQGGAAFDRIREAGRAAWNGMLGRIAVGGGTEQQRRTFYSALYHSLLHPSVLSDVDGRYPGMDGKVHRTEDGRVQYADFSGWDVYRSQIQLLALVAPDEASDIAQSVVNQGAQGGYFDRWTLANGGTGVMIGDPLPTIASEIHAFGGTRFDAEALLRQSLTGRHNDLERPGHPAYDSKGYLPVGTNGEWGPASGTLEYGSADFALSQLADRLGDRTDHDALLRASANWRNLFNPANGYVQPRRADGSWPKFDPSSGDQYAEGDGAQYTWMVPYNQRGLFDAMGGNAQVVDRLDFFFQKLNAGPTAPHAYLGNEPSLNTPWAYDYAGRPDRTADVVRRAVTTVFSDTPQGEVGNDDLGEMSSWAVWGSLGLYPLVPGRADLVLASPLFPHTTITRGNGVRIDLVAPQASADARYVHGLTVNGVPSNRPWVDRSLVNHGGRLRFRLADTADPSWGRDAADAPPSYDVGPDHPVAGTVTEPGGHCLTAAPAVRLADCGSGADQHWQLAGDGTVRSVGGCLTGTGTAGELRMRGCDGTGEQQWWPRRDGALVSPPTGRCLAAGADGLRLAACDGSSDQRWQLPDAAAWT
ncbi:GH92 family glycosyl hydrolase [Kitasatospora viridis]|uniref:Putative alpha-1,2-mannosidase n=1 Tax=Kitasatospora viridis TaxID=281105 RepID=A0A561UI29_9ACTN|nr:GH92 family glycosyl hydrolase [Kitasatospora viridis]TWF99031.1 putative alpha-1,2-mannosidase [Kitasatospora viridis]